MRRIIAVILALGALMALPAAFSASAYADGDPASDVLYSRPLFVPPDAGLTAEQAAQLTQLIRKATQAGYPIRVALINSAKDMGTVTQLWENPPTYSKYLARELSYVWHSHVLVVMPQGEGLYIANPTPADVKVMNNITLPGSALAESAFQTVQKLAAANGVTVSVGHVALAAGAGGGSLLPWLVFVIGLLLVAGAWGASVRIRPLTRRVPA